MILLKNFSKIFLTFLNFSNINDTENNNLYEESKI